MIWLNMGKISKDDRELLKVLCQESQLELTMSVEGVSWEE